ncbi:hypothetical protein EGW08_020807 [Elysia chlorotica]|uniref:Uncharacterized protein n=1 Tax=Elysia chlorotica TaxID=188477 RepID=A0A433SQL1_ELYCH|nr:hypothetical protein EGW08_020807 [Elysia chlorotica]
MPTLSQWKILSRLLLKKANEAAAAANNDTDAYGQCSDEEENAGNIASGVAQTHGQAVGASSISPNGEVFDNKYQSIPEERTQSGYLASDQHGSGDGVIGSSCDNLESSRSTVSPNPFHRGRPKSGKVVRIQEDVTEEDKASEKGMSVGNSETHMESGQRVSNGSETKGSFKKAGTETDKDGSGEHKAEDSKVVTGGEEKSGPEAIAMDEVGLILRKNPTRPCLKRSDSCFIRRPDSRTKSVTFGRPYSSTNLYSDGIENISDRNHASKQKCNTMNEYLRGGFTQSNSLARQSVTKIAIKNTELTFRDDQAAPVNTTRVNRPSSSGPTFWRAAQVVAAVK